MGFFSRLFRKKPEPRPNPVEYVAADKQRVLHSGYLYSVTQPKNWLWGQEMHGGAVLEDVFLPVPGMVFKANQKDWPRALHISGRVKVEHRQGMFPMAAIGIAAMLNDSFTDYKDGANVDAAFKYHTFDINETIIIPPKTPIAFQILGSVSYTPGAVMTSDRDDGKLKFRLETL